MQAPGQGRSWSGSQSTACWRRKNFLDISPHARGRRRFRDFPEAVARLHSVKARARLGVATAILLTTFVTPWVLADREGDLLESAAPATAGATENRPRPADALEGRDHTRRDWGSIEIDVRVTPDLPAAGDGDSEKIALAVGNTARRDEGRQHIAVATPQTGLGLYTVKSGDSSGKSRSAYGPRAWGEYQEISTPQAVAEGPDKTSLGQVLRIPQAADGTAPRRAPAPRRRRRYSLEAPTT